MPSVSEDGRIDASVERPYAEVCKGFTYFAENDVLFAKITPCMENGKGGVAKGLKNGVGFGSTEFHVLRPIKGVSDPYWLYIITMFSKFRSDAEKVMTGTGGQRRVPITYLSEYSITLPPIELQEQFAAFVRQSDKSKFILIGDSLTADISGGKSFGITTCWYDHNGTGYDNVGADIRIDSLSEIKSIL